MYAQPSEKLLEVMHAPLPPIPIISPTTDRMILVTWEKYLPVKHMARPYLRLGGVRIEPSNYSRRDTTDGNGMAYYARSFDLVQIATGEKIRVAFPEDPLPQKPIWSADGRLFAFTNVTADSVEVWIGDGQSGNVRKVPGACLNAMLEDELQWMPDQKTLLVKLIPDNMGQPPLEMVSPRTQECSDVKTWSSTYEARDALRNQHDEDLFEYYSTSQLAFIDTTSLVIQLIGKPGHYTSLDLAPDGQHLLVTALCKPYSYITTYHRFPCNIEVWKVSLHCSAIETILITSLPLADQVPIQGVQTGPRDIFWRVNVPATIMWAEALDGGDWRVDVPARDKIMMLQAPFKTRPVEIMRTQYRFEKFQWGEHKNIALLTEFDLNLSWNRTFLVDIDHSPLSPQLLWSFSLKEEYGHPGEVVHRQLPNGSSVIRQEGISIFLSGNGATTNGDRPFLDRLNLDSLKSTRLFRSDESLCEKFLDFDGHNTKVFLTRRQSVYDPPNIFRRTLQSPIKAVDGEATMSSQSDMITHIPNPTPVVRSIGKRLVRYMREDGVKLSFMLYTPPGYIEGKRLPTILHGYPYDYADQSTASQVSVSQVSFIRLNSYKLLLLEGYAIIDNVSFPIIGDPKRAYDSYVEQLVANAKAAVDEVVRIGVADPIRIGITGHSHGALMTVNLLAHSNLFAAGFASSGSYNKILTPFGFQNEIRSLWVAPDVYSKASPIFLADKIKTPLYIMHGEDDANLGTTPLQSEKLYEAIRGNGGTVKLVTLPHEPHWYKGKESNEHMVKGMSDWFGKFVKERLAEVSVEDERDCLKTLELLSLN